jgi:very-short-patch-repair endonuclease
MKRKETGIEKAVRLELKRRKIKFEQEYPVRIGRRRWCYYLDFFIPDWNLVIEVDGTYWHRTDAEKKRDARKDKRLAKLGFIVKRITEVEVNQDVTKAVGNIVDVFVNLKR